MTWMIRHHTEKHLYWTREPSPHWVELEDATEFTDDEKGAIDGPSMAPGNWVELWSCDGCGENMPSDTGELSMGYYSAASIDPPENYWFCEACLGRRDMAEETKAEQYYELK